MGVIRIPVPGTLESRDSSRESLRLRRCPHCGVDTPNISKVCPEFDSRDHNGARRLWSAYSCRRCGGVVIGEFYLEQASNTAVFYGYFPEYDADADTLIPDKPRVYLQQAIDSASVAPAGAIMLAASSVDAMLKEIGLKEGSLYARIEVATKGHKITESMQAWAHRVRLDANDQRHADEFAHLPTQVEACQVIEFTRALAEYLFVLPAKVAAGLERVSSK